MTSSASTTRGWPSTTPLTPISPDGGPDPAPDPLLASWRAQIEGRAFQGTGPEVVLGGGGFADDVAPAGALVQLGAADAVPAATLGAARAATVKIQGRNSTVPLAHPVAVPAGEWALTLQTTWVEPAYLEPDASWCGPEAPTGLPAGQRRRLRGKTAQPRPGPGARLGHGAREPGSGPVEP